MDLGTISLYIKSTKGIPNLKKDNNLKKNKNSSATL